MNGEGGSGLSKNRGTRVRVIDIHQQRRAEHPPVWRNIHWVNEAKTSTEVYRPFLCYYGGCGAEALLDMINSLMADDQRSIRQFA